VPSVALQTWKQDAKKALDQIAAAHEAVGGSGPGRRYATQEVNHAYAVLLTSQFQRFCRDLHTEAVAHVVAATSPTSMQPILRARMTEGRKLDQGNPNPGNLGSDFGRFGFSFWHAMKAQRPRNQQRQDALDNLAAWRNAIAHQDFNPTNKLTPSPPLLLKHLKAWRSACNALATEFDKAVRVHLTSLVGQAPW
jgi:hypothetical protein